ncbi:hypothetical protein F5887DRAFT_589559 [Amanita rubescens]|nr:hypothetical protein F5887DRAFT_589559 [Amanita rubescens]
MASGFGYTGGRSKCFTFWNQFQQCYIQSENPKECRPLSDDYLECLHKTKEVAHAKAVQDEFIRRAEAAATEGRKAADILAGRSNCGSRFNTAGRAARFEKH